MEQKTKCRFGVHDWTKWETIAKGTGITFLKAELPVRLQDRECNACGKQQMHVVETEQ